MTRAALATPPYAQLQEHLDRLLDTYGVADIESDPIRWVHGFTASADRELVGLLASTLAYGAVPIIQASVGDSLTRLGTDPAHTIDTASLDELRDRFVGFRHRFHDGEDMALLLHAAQRMRREFGSIGNAFTHFYTECDGDVREALAHTIDRLRGAVTAYDRTPHAGIWHSLPDPRRGSACKRWNLYLRWMVRPNDGVDFGLWTGVSPARLVIPLDTHVARIAKLVGMTARVTPDWVMAEQITAVLRTFDPHDPVKYDFAISRLGILKVCRSTRDASICTACPLDPVCCL